MPPRHIAAGGRKQRWADSCPEDPSGLFPPEQSRPRNPAPPPSPGSASSVGQRTKSQPVQFQRRPANPKGSTSTRFRRERRQKPLPGCSVPPLWTQSRLALMYVTHAGVAAPPVPRYTRSSLSMRSEQGSTNQQQPALALLIIPQHQTRCHAQPKMHAVHVFLHGRTDSVFPLRCRGGGGSVRLRRSFSPPRLFESK